MVAESKMQVRLADLPEDLHFVLDAKFVRDSIATLDVRQALERPEDDPDAGAAETQVHLYSEGDNVFVRGTISGSLEVACVRCLIAMPIQLNEDIFVSYLPKERVPVDDPDAEVEVTEDDLDLFSYEGESIDLEGLIRERLMLAVPYAPLCTKDCKGLCPHCGAERNIHPCECDRNIVDPRLAALKDIKL